MGETPRGALEEFMSPQVILRRHPILCCEEALPTTGLGEGDPVTQLWATSGVTQNCVVSHMCWMSLGLCTAPPRTGCQVSAQEGNGALGVGGQVWYSASPGLHSPHTCTLCVRVPVMSHGSPVPLGYILPREPERSSCSGPMWNLPPDRCL